ncbi:putative Superoxide dismutase (Cu-Zn) 1 [Hypsibius exemplaris]|uniref:Superoxide dismutase [Cu-Zn] n=1 Tax=Hypsibius exemplaris TaxID=2072580 RepID=A0A1W0XBB7_HYPEX|nr:putative Superoxide dismutase (Cu-Zn) 1 [Hypsibius exemplaris]
MGFTCWTTNLFVILFSASTAVYGLSGFPNQQQEEQQRNGKQQQGSFHQNQQQQQAEARQQPFPNGHNGPKPNGGGGGREFGGGGGSLGAREFNGFSPSRFNPQNAGPFPQREREPSRNEPNAFNRAPSGPFPGLGGSGRGFDGGMGPGPSGLSGRGLNMDGGPSNRPFEFNNMMAGQALLGAANLRQLEHALQARAQFMGGGGMGRGFGFPSGAGPAALELAASQLDPIAAAFVRPFFPTPRQDSGLGPSPYGPSAAINYDASVPQYRRPGGDPQPDSQYAAQFPFASAPYDPKQLAPVGYAKPLKAVVVLSSQFGITGVFNLSQSGVDQPVEITGRVNGLRPGDHGIHIHSLGDVSKSCESAGSHFNPEGVSHGSPDDVHSPPHAGDLGNIYAGDYGPAVFILSTPLISLYPPAPTLVIGRTLVIHEKPDDLGRGGDQQSRETGNAGARIACGIIGVSH